MKPTTIIPLTTACITAVVFSSCVLDPGYKAYKEQKKAEAQTANPYGVPGAGGETGSYTPDSGGAAPYQPLPGVTQTSPEPTTPQAGAVGSSSHLVVSGDSLWGLARKYNTTIEAIQEANGLTTTDIRTGQSLTIPGR